MKDQRASFIFVLRLFQLQSLFRFIEDLLKTMLEPWQLTYEDEPEDGVKELQDSNENNSPKLEDGKDGCMR